MRNGQVGWPPELVERYVRAGHWTGRALGRVWDRADAAPHGIAVVDGGTRIEYGRLARLVDGLALNLIGRGLGRGDTVLVQLPNCWEFVVLTLACLRSGTAPLMALPAHRRHELSYLAAQAEAAALVVPDTLRDFDHQALGATIRDEVECVRELLVVGETVAPGAIDLRALITEPADPDRARAELDAAAPGGREVAVFLLSGGTTGVPKIIPRTHDDYGYNARRCAELTETTGDTTYLVALPAGHNFPLACPGILGTLAEGGTVVLARSPEPARCFELIESEGVTLTAVVPAVAQRWIEYARQTGRPPTGLRTLQVGGSRMPVEAARQVRPVLGATLQQAFGMAEGMINLTRLDDPDDVIEQTQGRPICADDEIAVVDDDGTPVPDGHSGMLLARGPYTIRGYFRAEEHNARAFTPDGWYRTGDVVHRHPSGNLVVDGRTKDVIIRGGEKISAEEVENLVYTVSGVLRVAVIVSDPDRPAPTLADVRSALRELGVAAFKIPERLVVVDTLPVTPIGKIDKKRLRDELAGDATPTGR